MDTDGRVPDRAGAAAGSPGGDSSGIRPLTRPLPGRIVAALAGLGLTVGVTVAVLIWAILVLHEHDVNLEQKLLRSHQELCANERADRAADQMIAAHIGIRLNTGPVEGC